MIDKKKLKKKVKDWNTKLLAHTINAYQTEINLRKRTIKKKNKAKMKLQKACKHIGKVVFNTNSDSALLVCSNCGVVMCKVGQF